jgi:hypothetical protein
MNLRVNLLRPEEQRYQGPVSLRFAISVGGITVGCLLLILLLVGLHSYISVRRDLGASRTGWQKIEARFNAVTTKQKAETDNQLLLAELKKWNRQRVEWTPLLKELQNIAPPSVQFTRLMVRSDWNFQKVPGPTTSDGKEIPQPLLPARRYYVSLEGRAAGELADQVVVDFERTWRQSPGFQPLFESVKLQRLVREAVGGADRQAQADRLFLIEGEFRVRKLE